MTNCAVRTHFDNDESKFVENVFWNFNIEDNTNEKTLSQNPGVQKRLNIGDIIYGPPRVGALTITANTVPNFLLTVRGTRI